jgi:quinol---cytochrome c reductase iron-sulfur subunit, bacillus type
VEPHGERPHVPGPSLWPIGFAVGIACVLVGLVVSWPAAAVGAALALIFGFLWIRDVTGDYRGEERAVAEGDEAPVVEEAELHAYSRSKFLELSTLGLGGVITGIVTVPILGFAVLPAFTNQELPDIDLGPLENFPEDKWIETTYLSNPKEGEVSRRTAYIRNNGDLRPGVPSFTIISNRCVHLGCPVQASGPRAEEEKKVQTKAGELTVTEVTPAAFSCPCHGGAYDLEGNRTAGPPVRSLDRYEFKIEGDRLVLAQVYSVAKVEGEGADAMIKRYEHMGPGIHVDGPEAWLYPISPAEVAS